MKDDVPVINPEGLFIPEMRFIWERDESEDKQQAQGELAYIYHMADPRSVYRKLPEEKREKQIIEDYLGESFHSDKDIDAAIEKYKLLYETPSMRFLKSVEKVLDKLAKYLNDVDITDGRGGNLTQIISAVEKGEATIASYGKLVDKVEREINTKMVKRRGDVEPSFLDLED